MKAAYIARLREEYAENYVSIRKAVQAPQQSVATDAKQLVLTRRQGEISGELGRYFDEMAAPAFEKLRAEYYKEMSKLPDSKIGELDSACADFVQLTKRVLAAHSEMRQLGRDCGREVGVFEHFVLGNRLQPSDALDPDHVRKCALGIGPGPGSHRGQKTSFGGRVSV